MENIKDLSNESLLELQDNIDLELYRREKLWIIILNF